jgi:hypothetical protein
MKNTPLSIYFLCCYLWHPAAAQNLPEGELLYVGAKGKRKRAEKKERKALKSAFQEMMRPEQIRPFGFSTKISYKLAGLQKNKRISVLVKNKVEKPIYYSKVDLQYNKVCYKTSRKTRLFQQLKTTAVQRAKVRNQS